MCWKHIWYMDKCVDGWSTNQWMNKCDTNFSSFNKFMCQICFQWMILVCEMYELWMYEFYTIFITKLSNINLWCYNSKQKGKNMKTSPLKR
jgi:hypothetical protein